MSKTPNKTKKVVKKIIKVEKNKIKITIFYVPLLSLVMTKKFELEIYEGMTLNEIMNEIEKRSNFKKFIKNYIFALVENRKIVQFLDPKKIHDLENKLIFCYEIEKNLNNTYNIPIYIYVQSFSAYPRFLSFQERTSYYDFLLKIYILIRKYLMNPYYEKGKKEIFEADNIFSDYIEERSTKLDKVLELLVQEFNFLNNRSPHSYNYHKLQPYQIFLRIETDKDNYKEKFIYNGFDNNVDLLKDFNISSNND
jgi:hypothetical protein